MVSTRTRLGRNIKKPDFFKPTEDVLDDDYCDDDHDTDFDSEIDTEDEEDFSDEEDEEDADENGNLKDFVVEDESESEEEDA
jgi:hypothetical protein